MEVKVLKVDIGFVEECEGSKLHSRFFPSKIGGKPAWLNLRDLPKPNEVQCKKCGDPCIFLCQIYAPIDDKDDAFHRTLFIFVCKKSACCQSNNADNFVVFRCQLKRKNEFYPFEPPTENEVFDDEKWPTLCSLCGAKGPNHCGKCKKIKYCSRVHQVYDWKNGHKEICDADNPAVATELPMTKNNFLFPQWELIIDEETEESPTKTSEEDELNYLNKLIDDKKAGTLMDENEAELEQYTNKEVEDKTFEKFKERIGRDPGQVLRYERGGTPLWISAQPLLKDEDIPNCLQCNSKRQYECQIMPQLLNFLNLEIGPYYIDWGVLAIYTCENNCSSQTMAYNREYMFKQDVSEGTTPL